jgi:hypothetical protein
MSTGRLVAFTEPVEMSLVDADPPCHRAPMAISDLGVRRADDAELGRLAAVEAAADRPPTVSGRLRAGSGSA